MEMLTQYHSPSSQFFAQKSLSAAIALLIFQLILAKSQQKITPLLKLSILGTPHYHSIIPYIVKEMYTSINRLLSSLLSFLIYFEDLSADMMHLFIRKGKKTLVKDLPSSLHLTKRNLV